MALIGLLAMAGSVISIVWMIISAIRKKPMKKPVITFVACIVIFFVAFSGDSDSSKNSSDDKPKVEKKEKVEEKETKQSKKENTKEFSKVEESSNDVEKTNQYTEINKEIAIQLEQSLGWALGKLDRDGNPTDNGEPNEEFNWAIFVTKIELSEKDDQLEVYVTPEFKELPEESKKQIINYAQNVSIANSGETTPKFTVIFDGNKTIGRSRITDIRDFSW